MAASTTGWSIGKLRAIDWTNAEDVWAADLTLPLLMEFHPTLRSFLLGASSLSPQAASSTEAALMMEKVWKQVEEWIVSAGGFNANDLKEITGSAQWAEIFPFLTIVEQFSSVLSVPNPAGSTFASVVSSVLSPRSPTATKIGTSDKNSTKMSLTIDVYGVLSKRALLTLLLSASVFSLTEERWCSKCRQPGHTKPRCGLPLPSNTPTTEVSVVEEAAGGDVRVDEEAGDDLFDGPKAGNISATVPSSVAAGKPKVISVLQRHQEVMERHRVARENALSTVSAHTRAATAAGVPGKTGPGANSVAGAPNRRMTVIPSQAVSDLGGSVSSLLSGPVNTNRLGNQGFGGFGGAGAGGAFGNKAALVGLENRTFFGTIVVLDPVQLQTVLFGFTGNNSKVGTGGGGGERTAADYGEIDCVQVPGARLSFYLDRLDFGFKLPKVGSPVIFKLETYNDRLMAIDIRPHVMAAPVMVSTGMPGSNLPPTISMPTLQPSASPSGTQVPRSHHVPPQVDTYCLEDFLGFMKVLDRTANMESPVSLMRYMLTKHTDWSFFVQAMLVVASGGKLNGVHLNSVATQTSGVVKGPGGSIMLTKPNLPSPASNMTPGTAGGSTPGTNAGAAASPPAAAPAIPRDMLFRIVKLLVCTVTILQGSRAHVEPLQRNLYTAFIQLMMKRIPIPAWAVEEGVPDAATLAGATVGGAAADVSVVEEDGTVSSSSPKKKATYKSWCLEANGHNETTTALFPDLFILCLPDSSESSIFVGSGLDYLVHAAQFVLLVRCLAPMEMTSSSSSTSRSKSAAAVSKKLETGDGGEVASPQEDDAEYEASMTPSSRSVNLVIQAMQQLLQDIMIQRGGGEASGNASLMSASSILATSSLWLSSQPPDVQRKWDLIQRRLIEATVLVSFNPLASNPSAKSKSRQAQQQQQHPVVAIERSIFLSAVEIQMPPSMENISPISPYRLPILSKRFPSFDQHVAAHLDLLRADVYFSSATAIGWSCFPELMVKMSKMNVEAGGGGKNKNTKSNASAAAAASDASGVMVLRKEDLPDDVHDHVLDDLRHTKKYTNIRFQGVANSRDWDRPAGLLVSFEPLKNALPDVLASFVSTPGPQSTKVADVETTAASGSTTTTSDPTDATSSSTAAVATAPGKTTVTTTTTNSKTAESCNAPVLLPIDSSRFVIIVTQADAATASSIDPSEIFWATTGYVDPAMQDQNIMAVFPLNGSTELLMWKLRRNEQLAATTAAKLGQPVSSVRTCSVLMDTPVFYQGVKPVATALLAFLGPLRMELPLSQFIVEGKLEMTMVRTLSAASAAAAVAQNPPSTSSSAPSFMPKNVGYIAPHYAPVFTDIVNKMRSRLVLDSGQDEALLSMQRSPIMLIQGPPGTGKSFIGCRLAEVFLRYKHRLKTGIALSSIDVSTMGDAAPGEETSGKNGTGGGGAAQGFSQNTTTCNRAMLDRSPGPVVVITYKNHALDEFLVDLKRSGVWCSGSRHCDRCRCHGNMEGCCVKCCQHSAGIVRVGGGSQEPLLNGFNMMDLVEAAPPNKEAMQAKHRVGTMTRRLQTIAENVRLLENGDLPPAAWHMWLTTEQLQDFKPTEDVIPWLRGDRYLLSVKEGLPTNNASAAPGAAKVPPTAAELQLKRYQGTNLRAILSAVSVDDPATIQARVKQLRQSNNKPLNADDGEGEDVEDSVFAKMRREVRSNDQRDGVTIRQSALSGLAYELGTLWLGLGGSRPASSVPAWKLTAASLSALIPDVGPAGSTSNVDLAAASEAIRLLTRPSTLPPSITSLQSIWSLSPPQRIQLYQWWLSQEIAVLGAEYIQVTASLEIEVTLLNHAREASKLAVLRQADVVGLTTTGCAMNQHLLRALKPSLLIVEEAAEILESQLLACMTDSLHQVILIGDHYQLQPKVETMLLQKHNHMHYSLFERFVRLSAKQTPSTGSSNNDSMRSILRGSGATSMGGAVDVLEVKSTPIRLVEQRRMKPAISALIRPFYEGQLTDHFSVLQRRYVNARGQMLPSPSSPVPGLQRDVFFWTHNTAESMAPMGRSKVNVREMSLVCGLVRHLLLEGCRAESIVVVTPYLGQRNAVKERLKDLFSGGSSQSATRGGKTGTASATAPTVTAASQQQQQQVIPSTVLEDIRISTVDRFQGDEGDVVILSLVRTSNLTEFIRTRNRLIVACSRARFAMIVLCNDTLLDKSEHWKLVLDMMRRDGGGVGELLPVTVGGVPAVVKSDVHLSKWPTAIS